MIAWLFGSLIPMMLTGSIIKLGDQRRFGFPCATYDAYARWLRISSPLRGIDKYVVSVSELFADLFQVPMRFPYSPSLHLNTSTRHALFLSIVCPRSLRIYGRNTR